MVINIRWEKWHVTKIHTGSLLRLTGSSSGSGCSSSSGSSSSLAVKHHMSVLPSKCRGGQFG